MTNFAYVSGHRQCLLSLTIILDKNSYKYHIYTIFLKKVGIIWNTFILVNNFSIIVMVAKSRDNYATVYSNGRLVFTL